VQSAACLARAPQPYFFQEKMQEGGQWVVNSHQRGSTARSNYLRNSKESRRIENAQINMQTSLRYKGSSPAARAQRYLFAVEGVIACRARATQPYFFI
jgi:hypothetical protein